LTETNVPSTTTPPTEGGSSTHRVISPELLVARSQRRHVAFIATAVLAALAVFVVLIVRRPRGAAAHSVPPPDVPRAEGSAIVFSEAFRKRAGIRTATIAHRDVVPELRVVGTVTFDPERVAAVGTRIRGLVRKLAKIEGDAVKEGDLLAEIESAELGEAQAKVATIEAHRKAAELNAKRERDLFQRKLSTAREAEVAAAKLAEQSALLTAARQKVRALGGNAGGGLGTYLLRAPISGTVVERHVSAGQSVEGNLIAYRVADLDHLWIELAVFERRVDAIRKGDVVEIRPLAHPDRVIEGSVAYVADALDPASRTAAVRVKIDNSKRHLRPGQSVTASIRASGPTRNALVAPTSAVTWVDGKPTLFVATGDDRVVPTRVELGAVSGSEQEIVSGVEAGTVIVSDGVFALKSELYR
jgi:membrane fusion protein, heavy metal efflux system